MLLSCVGPTELYRTKTLGVVRANLCRSRSASRLVLRGSSTHWPLTKRAVPFPFLRDGRRSVLRCCSRMPVHSRSSDPETQKSRAISQGERDFSSV
jgi:hypothetical protein